MSDSFQITNLNNELFPDITSSVGDFSAAGLSKKSNELFGKLNSSGFKTEFNSIYSAQNAVNVISASNIAQNNKSLGNDNLSINENIEEGIPVGDNATAGFRVKLISRINRNDKVEFLVSPTISEGRTASYSQPNILHHPGQLQIYNSTSARTWTIDTILVSRTAQEAENNLRDINLIRSWVMPYYGVGTENNPETKSKLGAPPDVLTFSAYGDRVIGPVSVVMLGYSWSWPNEIDYIKTMSGVPFPVIFNIHIDILESYSIREYSNFSLAAYKTGNLENAFPVEAAWAISTGRNSGWKS